jgi:peptidyl-prolyl cis-trans isomerase SurA
MQTRDPNVISVQEQEMYKELLDRMIDDRLEEQQADKAHITVAPEEIDRGITNIATQAQQQQGRPVTPADVMGEVRRRGLSEQDFRDEIRRQILEGKLIELRVRPRVRTTDQDARSAYQHWVDEMKDQEPMDVRILALRQYSDDVPTRTTCGSHGPQPFATLLPAIQDAVRSLNPGEVSNPIPVQIGQEQVIVVLMPMGQARVPPFTEVKDEMTQKALLEGLERARKQWLKELRRGTYIDIRL